MKQLLRAIPDSYAQATASVRPPVLPPFTAVVEIVLAFGAILAFGWAVPTVDLYEIRPHPFWIPVLLLSLQYGTVSGLLAATIAIALTAFNGFPEQSTSDSFFTYFLKIWIEPILWIGAAVLLGQFRMRQIAAKQNLAQQVVLLSSQRAAIADHAANLRTHCDALERRLAGRREPDALLLLDGLHRISQLQTHDLGTIFGDVMQLALPNAHATLLVRDGSNLRPIATSGGGVNPTHRSSYSSSDMLYEAVVNQRLAVSVLTPDGERWLDGQGLAAVPVVDINRSNDAEGGRTIGMIKVEAIEASWLGATTLPVLHVIAAAFAPALANTRDHSSDNNGSINREQQQPSPMVTKHSPVQGGARFLRRLQWMRGGAAGNGAKPLSRMGG